MFSQRFKTVIC